MVLDAIVSYKKELLRTKRSGIDELRRRALKADRSLHAALKSKAAAFILEIKPASPSKGVIRADVDIDGIADIYAPFANAISVLADDRFFGGSLSNVERVSQRVRCPVLAKDVVIDPLQIIEARAHGAHAVLLMLSVLDDDAYLACAHTARELNMDFITEVHDESEMARANKFKAPIIGINNRNLRTLAIDVQTSVRLSPLAHRDALLIAESGISQRMQLKRLAPSVHGFLIGTSLMKAPRIDLALRELLFGRVKICGLTNRRDAQAAYGAGAYYGGLNFYPNSKRVVQVAEAEDIIAGSPLIFGGVFVNQAVDDVIRVAERLKLRFVQIHGDETEDYMRDLRRQLPSTVEIWRAVRVKDRLSIPSYHLADRLLLDAFSQVDYGGTGKTFDWSLLKNLAPHGFVFAGGITPKNVAIADGYGPFAIDIASGVEGDDPRKKSHAKINELFSQLRPRGCI